MWKRAVMAMVVALSSAAVASGQTSAPQTGQPGQQPPAQQAPASVPAETGETRPATTTYLGDTGLWFVPTGELLPARRWSVSAYRVNFDYTQGFTDVSDWPITFGVGVGDRAELFGSFSVVRRIDRDVRPLFLTGSEPGGMVNQYPFVRDGWSGNKIGDFWVGGKVNLASEFRQHPMAFALRGLIKLPTASADDEGVGTGKLDFAIDAILSKELNQRVEVSGFGGLMFRGDPDDVNLSNGLRWGVGAAMPSRGNLRFTAELHGEAHFDDTITNSRVVTAIDGTVAPATSAISSPVNVSLGLTWQGRNGTFVGTGINWNTNAGARSDFGYGDVTGDSLGFQFRIGYHPGVRVYVAPAPPPPPPPPVVANRPPTVTARCEPCTVEVGKASTITADATDPDGDPLTYRWSAPAGTLTSPNDRVTPWTAPMQPGPVQMTVQVDDGRGGKAAANVTVQVVEPARKEYVFEDVHFDFDRYSLRPEATRALDEAIRTLQENAELRIEIEGHTCNIGTAEYNLALGERRAHAVRDYLSGRGIGADRLRTVSYGEERAKHDNAREETRRLNRRAALIVRVQ